MESGGSGNIKKLKESNFPAWKQKCFLLLALRDLDEYIEEAPPDEDDPNRSTWLRNDRKARAVTGMSLFY